MFLNKEVPFSFSVIPKNAEERCKSLRCPYGTLKYWDDRTQCEDCYCNEPCQVGSWYQIIRLFIPSGSDC